MHILVGQDTDSESTPYGAAMPWIVKLDKEEDFIGQWALEHAAEQPAETALVGFTLPDGDVPTEGAAVLDGDGEPVGQVTSARYSPPARPVIGMAWVPAALAERRRARSRSPTTAARLRAEVQHAAVLRPRRRGAALVTLRVPRADGARAVARSPMERQARAAGARFELRDGWNVAVGYGARRARALRASRSAGPTSRTWASSSSTAPRATSSPGWPRARDGAWWCPLTRDRALVIGDAAVRERVEDAVDVTHRAGRADASRARWRARCSRASARSTCARRSRRSRGFRPGSVARTPGDVLREDADRFLMLFGSALGEYLWTVVADAAEHLGGGPVGVDALEREAARA